MLPEHSAQKIKEKIREESKVYKPKQSQQPNNGSNTVKGPIAILGDSMLKPSRLQRSIGKKIVVKTFVTVAEMKHYWKPTLEKNPELIILHIGTNGIHQMNQKKLSGK